MNGPVAIGAWRLLTAAAVLLLVAGGVAARVVMLQAEEERNFLKRQGDARTVRTLSVQPARGVIRDRRGEPLAVSTPVAAVWVNPRQFRADHPAVPELAAALDYTVADLEARVARAAGREFLYLRRQVSPDRAESIAALGVPGIDLQDEYRRFYPAGEVAAHVVGITNIDDQGIEGLELAYDAWLTGSPGRKRVIRDRRGRVVRDLEYLAMSEPGQELTLSIDLRLQYLAYRELTAAMKQYQAESGTVVVLDTRTGEVLAMVNWPSYNPNAPVTSQFERLRNRAVTDLYEPGSTVKPITIAAALESGRLRREEIINTSPGWVRVSGKLITDPLDRGKLDLEQIVARSSQVGIAHIALALDDDLLREAFGRFGFGQITGIGFPGETSGVLPEGARWPLIDRVTFAFGYGLAVTPLQLAQAYAVFANRGVLRAPSLLRLDAAEAGERVLDAALAAEISHMLEGVVRDDGTAARARIPGYPVAGKTGTVRKVGPGGYDNRRHLAFFAGYAPAADPRVATVVVINEPKGEQIGGGAVAAPVFSRVVAGALRLLSEPPEGAPLMQARAGGGQ
ncbi:MAG: penicillin-binding protein 2 [Gammaproteobacteria bacterium]|nr:MAG: penicillin-binding protein 2 [Gammaproteobacteria bacterium]